MNEKSQPAPWGVTLPIILRSGHSQQIGIVDRQLNAQSLISNTNFFMGGDETADFQLIAGLGVAEYQQKVLGNQNSTELHHCHRYQVESSVRLVCGI
jgi:hypothetical protein